MTISIAHVWLTKTYSIPRPSYGLDILWLAVWIGAPAAMGFLIGLVVAPILRLLNRLAAVAAILLLLLALRGLVQIDSVASLLSHWLAWFGDATLPAGSSQSPETLGALAAFLVGKCLGLAAWRSTRAREGAR